MDIRIPVNLTDNALQNIGALKDEIDVEQHHVTLLHSRLAKDQALLLEEQKELENLHNNGASSATRRAEKPLSRSARGNGELNVISLLKEFGDLEAEEDEAFVAWTSGIFHSENDEEARPYLQFTVKDDASNTPQTIAELGTSSAERSSLINELLALERQIGDERDEIFADKLQFERNRRLLERELRDRLSQPSDDVDRKDLRDSESPNVSAAVALPNRWGDFRATPDKIQTFRRQHTFLGMKRLPTAPKIPQSAPVKVRERARSVDLGTIAVRRLRRDATREERWEPPDLMDDPVTFPLKLVNRFTMKRLGDRSSIRYDDDGDLIQASTRDLFLLLITGRDAEFSRHFLLAANYFLSPITLLQLFVLFYRSPSAKNEKSASKIRSNVLDLCGQWISTQYATLKGSKRWVEIFERFVEYLKRGKEPDAINHAERLHRFWQGIKLSKLMEAPRIKTPKEEVPPENFVFTDIDPLDLARQITLKEQQFFHSIPLSEYYKLAWAKDDGHVRAPNLLKIIRRFNEVSYWVAATITTKIGEEEADDLSTKERAQLVSYWIRVLGRLVAMHNYNSALQIYSALNLTPIERLKATWSAVPRSDVVIFEAFTSKLASNFKGYRDELEVIMQSDAAAVERPCIPMHSLVLRDLSMVEEMDDFNTDGTVNWSKIALVASAFQTIQGFRSKKYTFNEDRAIQALLWHTPSITDDALYQRSAEINTTQARAKWKSSPKVHSRKGSIPFSPLRSQNSSASSLSASSPGLSMSMLTQSSNSDSDGAFQHSNGSQSGPAPPIVRRESLLYLRSNMKRPRASSDGADLPLSVSTPAPSTSKHFPISKSPAKPSKASRADSWDKKRSIRDVLFGVKKSDAVAPTLPLKFADLYPGSEIYANFKSYLEKRLAAEHLDVYSMIEKVESGSHWSPEEVRFACHGLCSKYLGFGEESELIAVDEMVRVTIKERLASPSIVMFKELKDDVAQTLEEHYTNFLETGGVATELRVMPVSARRDSSLKEAQNTSRSTSAPKLGEKPRHQSKLGFNVSTGASASKRGSHDSNEDKK